MAFDFTTLESAAEDMINKLKASVDDVAVMLSKSESVMVKLAEGRVSVVQQWREYEISLYIAKNRRVLVNEFSTTSLEEAVKRTLALAANLELLEESEYYAPLPNREERVVDDTKHSSSVEKVLENPSTLVDDLYSNLQENGVSKAAGMVKAVLSGTVLLTTGGFRGLSVETSVNGYLRVFGEKTSGQWSFTGTGYEREKMRAMVDKASYYASLNLPYEAIEPQRTRLLLTPMVLGNLADYYAHAASAMAVDMGMSFLVGRKPGDKVASEAFTLRDVPRNPSLPGGGLFDAEGVDTRDKPIVEKGVLKTLLHNTRTAARHGVESTGNAGWLYPHAFDLQVDPGDMGEEEAVREMKDGIVVTNNWYTRLQNYIAGQFSTVARDAIIIVKNGEPKALVRKMRIADTFPHLFQSITGLTRTLYPIEWWEVETPSLLPYALVEGVQVTSRS